MKRNKLRGQKHVKKLQRTGHECFSIEKSTSGPEDNSRVGSLQGNDSSGSDTVLSPWYAPWIVCAVTLIFRVDYVCQPENWWILHPDEIFQTLEVAHTEVYGYGFRPYEYLPQTHGDPVTPMRQSEVQKGMHSMRSFLLPRFFVLVSYLAEMTGYTGAPFILWKISHAVVAACLPLAVYKLTRVLFRSHDVGVLAAILTATSAHLTVFGTHTLINSFCGTPVCFALGMLFEDMLHIKSKPDVHATPKSDIHPKSKPDIIAATKPDIHATSKPDGSYQVTERNEKEMSSSCAYLETDLDQPQKPNHYTFPYDSYAKTISNNNNNNNNNNNIELKGLLRISNGICLFEIPSVSVHKRVNTYSCSNGNNGTGIRPYETIRQPVTTNGNVGESIDTSRGSRWNMKAMIACVLLAMCCYIRVDISLFVVVTLLPHFQRGCVTPSTVLQWIMGGAMGLGICIMDDFNSYGFGVITPYHWLKFNVWENFSAVIYGRMNWTWYTRRLLIECPSLMLVIATSAAVIVCTSLKYHVLPKDYKSQYKTMCKLIVTLALLFVIYSVKGHKELRFMHNVLVLLFMTFAFCIFSIACYLKETFSKRVSQGYVVLSVGLFILSQWHHFPSSADKSVKSWTYTGNSNSHDTVACFNYVSQQDGVTGVYNDQMMFLSGGFAILHKNVPIVTLVHFEFYEFSLQTRTRLPSAAFLRPKKELSVQTFTETSEFISIYSTPYLLKHLISKPEYNYFVIDTNVQFLAVGFDEVFRSGSRKVLKRNIEAYKQKNLQEFAMQLRDAKNATILTYEGDWLMQFNQTLAAKQRFQLALSLDLNFVEAYKLLALCCIQLGDVESYHAVIRTCAKRLTKDVCMEKVKRIQLHESYNIGM